MAKLTADMVMVRTRVSDLSAVKKFNCWGGGLQDISVIRRMTNLEVLSLSVNKISSLADIQDCKNLKELYVRKNEIKNLNEICYLKDLPYLKALWLAENPCSENDPLYRHTVIKNLPNLEKLDNVEVTPEEKPLAFKKGRDLVHPEDYDYENSSPTESPYRGASRSPPISGRSSDRSDRSEEESNDSRKSYSPDYEQYHSPQDTRTSQIVEHPEDRYYKVACRPSETASDQQCNGTDSDSEKQTDRQCTSYSNRCNSDTSLTLKKDRNLIDSNTKILQKGNNLGRSEYDITADNKEGYCNCSAQYDRRSRESIYRYRDPEENVRYSCSEVSRCSSPLRGDRCHRYCDHYRISERNCKSMPPPYLHRRSITQNSNLLSAALCLIKEFDYRSLEVVAAAVKGRMNEFDSMRRS